MGQVIHRHPDYSVLLERLEINGYSYRRHDSFGEWWQDRYGHMVFVQAPAEAVYESIPVEFEHSPEPETLQALGFPS